MNDTPMVASYARVIGILLLIEGIWGLFSPVVFGVLSTNVLHATIHILLGISGLWAGRNGRGGSFSLFVGALLLMVGALWFVPGAGDLITRLLNVNHAVACVNIVVGALSLFIGTQASRGHLGVR